MHQLKGGCVVEQDLPVLVARAEILAPRVNVEGHALVRRQLALHSAHNTLRGAYVIAVDVVVVSAPDPQVVAARRPLQARHAALDVAEQQRALWHVLHIDADTVGIGASCIGSGVVGVER